MNRPAAIQTKSDAQRRFAQRFFDPLRKVFPAGDEAVNERCQPRNARPDVGAVGMQAHDQSLVRYQVGKRAESGEVVTNQGSASQAAAAGVVSDSSQRMKSAGGRPIFFCELPSTGCESSSDSRPNCPAFPPASSRRQKFPRRPAGSTNQERCRIVADDIFISIHYPGRANCGLQFWLNAVSCQPHARTTITQELAY